MGRLTKVLTLVAGGVVAACGQLSFVSPSSDSSPSHTLIPAGAYELTLTGCGSCDSLTKPSMVLDLQEGISGQLIVTSVEAFNAAIALSGFGSQLVPDTTMTMGWWELDGGAQEYLTWFGVGDLILSLSLTPGARAGPFTCGFGVRSLTDPNLSVAVTCGVSAWTGAKGPIGMRPVAGAA